MPRRAASRSKGSEAEIAGITVTRIHGFKVASGAAYREYTWSRQGNGDGRGGESEVGVVLVVRVAHTYRNGRRLCVNANGVRVK